MADVKVRNLEDHLAGVLRARAERQGISVAEEARRALGASVVADRGGAGARRRANHPQGAGRLGLSFRLITAAGCDRSCQ